METKNPPPMMTEKIPTTKPPTRRSAVLHVSQDASPLFHERSITLFHPDASDGMHRLPLHRRMTRIAFSAAMVISENACWKIAWAHRSLAADRPFFLLRYAPGLRKETT